MAATVVADVGAAGVDVRLTDFEIRGGSTATSLDEFEDRDGTDTTERARERGTHLGTAIVGTFSRSLLEKISGGKAVGGEVLEEALGGGGVVVAAFG